MQLHYSSLVLTYIGFKNCVREFEKGLHPAWDPPLKPNWSYWASILRTKMFPC